MACVGGEMKYIHYGATAFDRKKFKKIRNAMGGFTKPMRGTGFWASPVQTTWGWKDWCDSNEPDWYEEKKSFIFTLKEDAKVLHLYSIDDALDLPRRPTYFNALWIVPDFEKAAKFWDAIELHLSQEVKDRGTEGLYFGFYGWDCDSILIMNPEIIVMDKEL